MSAPRVPSFPEVAAIIMVFKLSLKYTTYPFYHSRGDQSTLSPQYLSLDRLNSDGVTLTNPL